MMRTNEDVQNVPRTRLGNYSYNTRLKWLCHIKRMKDHREPKRALQGIASGWIRERERERKNKVTA
jgi:hypothetical protein